MYKNRNRATHSSGHKKKRNTLTLLLVVLLTSYCLPTVAQEKTNKIQQSINAIKDVYDSKSKDYITDGKIILWVKSYKRWVPSDLLLLKKEDTQTLNFLNQAIAHNRMDVLEQLLPDYYRHRGGAKQFAEDIKNTK